MPPKIFGDKNKYMKRLSIHSKSSSSSSKEEDEEQQLAEVRRSIHGLNDMLLQMTRERESVQNLNARSNSPSTRLQDDLTVGSRSISTSYKFDHLLSSSTPPGSASDVNAHSRNNSWTNSRSYTGSNHFPKRMLPRMSPPPPPAPAPPSTDTSKQAPSKPQSSNLNLTEPTPTSLESNWVYATELEEANYFSESDPEILNSEIRNSLHLDNDDLSSNSSLQSLQRPLNKATKLDYLGVLINEDNPSVKEPVSHEAKNKLRTKRPSNQKNRYRMPSPPLESKDKEYADYGDDDKYSVENLYATYHPNPSIDSVHLSSQSSKLILPTKIKGRKLDSKDNRSPHQSPRKLPQSPSKDGSDSPKVAKDVPQTASTNPESANAGILETQIADVSANELPKNSDSTNTSKPEQKHIEPTKLTSTPQANPEPVQSNSEPTAKHHKSEEQHLDRPLSIHIPPEENLDAADAASIEIPHRSSKRGKYSDLSRLTEVTEVSVERTPDSRSGITHRPSQQETPTVPKHHPHTKTKRRVSAENRKSKVQFDKDGIDQLLKKSKRYDVNDLDLPEPERYLLNKFIVSLSNLSVEIQLDETKREEGRRRLNNAIKALEGWI